MPQTLDKRLLTAHADGDEAVLSTLYTEAADGAEARGDGDAAAFYLTHAYVYALASGSARAGRLNRRLAAMQRDEEQADLPDSH